MEIEKILNNLIAKGIAGVFILKANKGYSAVPITREEYSNFILLKEHWNGETVQKALEKLNQGNLA